MRTPIVLPLLSPLILILPGCIPLYLTGARVAVSSIAGVASGVAGGAPAEAELPQEKAALLELYKSCLTQRNMTPSVDCERYRAAVLEATIR